MALEALKILFEGDDWLALDKPGGLSVHNDQAGGSLIERLETERKVKFYPVHRLDKETSGIQVLALTDKAARRLAEQFEGRSVKKIYQGVVRGALKNESGEWTWPISDRPEGRRAPAGLAKDRKDSRTKYLKLKSNRYFTLLEFDLLTGRMHQLRKHCALAKHPLVGDARYNDAKYNAMIEGRYNEPRLFLHCHKLVIDGVTLVAVLPEEFDKLFAEDVQPAQS